MNSVTRTGSRSFYSAQGNQFFMTRVQNGENIENSECVIESGHVDRLRALFCDQYDQNPQTGCVTTYVNAANVREQSGGNTSRSSKENYGLSSNVFGPPQAAAHVSRVRKKKLARRASSVNKPLSGPCRTNIQQRALLNVEDNRRKKLPEVHAHDSRALPNKHIDQNPIDFNSTRALFQSSNAQKYYSAHLRSASQSSDANSLNNRSPAQLPRVDRKSENGYRKNGALSDSHRSDSDEVLSSSSMTISMPSSSCRLSTEVAYELAHRSKVHNSENIGYVADERLNGIRNRVRSWRTDTKSPDHITYIQPQTELRYGIRTGKAMDKCSETSERIRQKSSGYVADKRLNGKRNDVRSWRTDTKSPDHITYIQPQTELRYGIRTGEAQDRWSETSERIRQKPSPDVDSRSGAAPGVGSQRVIEYGKSQIPLHYSQASKDVRRVSGDNNSVDSLHKVESLDEFDRMIKQRQNNILAMLCYLPVVKDVRYYERIPNDESFTNLKNQLTESTMWSNLHNQNGIADGIICEKDNKTTSHELGDRINPTGKLRQPSSEVRQTVDNCKSFNDPRNTHISEHRDDKAAFRDEALHIMSQGVVSRAISKRGQTKILPPENRLDGGDHQDQVSDLHVVSFKEGRSIAVDSRSVDRSHSRVHPGRIDSATKTGKSTLRELAKEQTTAAKVSEAFSEQRHAGYPINQSVEAEEYVVIQSPRLVDGPKRGPHRVRPNDLELSHNFDPESSVCPSNMSSSPSYRDTHVAYHVVPYFKASTKDHNRNAVTNDNSAVMSSKELRRNTDFMMPAKKSETVKQTSELHTTEARKLNMDISNRRSIVGQRVFHYNVQNSRNINSPVGYKKWLRDSFRGSPKQRKEMQCNENSFSEKASVGTEEEKYSDKKKTVETKEIIKQVPRISRVYRESDSALAKPLYGDNGFNRNKTFATNTRVDVGRTEMPVGRETVERWEEISLPNRDNGEAKAGSSINTIGGNTGRHAQMNVDLVRANCGGKVGATSETRDIVQTISKNHETNFCTNSRTENYQSFNKSVDSRGSPGQYNMVNTLYKKPNSFLVNTTEALKQQFLSKANKSECSDTLPPLETVETWEVMEKIPITELREASLKLENNDESKNVRQTLQPIYYSHVYKGSFSRGNEETINSTSYDEKSNKTNMSMKKNIRLHDKVSYPPETLETLKQQFINHTHHFSMDAKANMVGEKRISTLQNVDKMEVLNKISMRGAEVASTADSTRHFPPSYHTKVDKDKAGSKDERSDGVETIETWEVVEKILKPHHYRAPALRNSVIRKGILANSTHSYNCNLSKQFSSRLPSSHGMAVTFDNETQSAQSPMGYKKFLEELPKQILENRSTNSMPLSRPQRWGSDVHALDSGDMEVYPKSDSLSGRLHAFLGDTNSAKQNTTTSNQSMSPAAAVFSKDNFAKLLKKREITNRSMVSSRLTKALQQTARLPTSEISTDERYTTIKVTDMRTKTGSPQGYRKYAPNLRTLNTERSHASHGTGSLGRAVVKNRTFQDVVNKRKSSNNMNLFANDFKVDRDNPIYKTVQEFLVTV